MGLSIVLCVMTLATFQVCSSIVVYDCGRSEMNYTAVSLLDVKPCTDKTPVVKEQTVKVQLLQLKETYPIKVIQCKIDLTYLVTYCGMHSHSSVVAMGFQSKIITVGHDECDAMQRLKTAYVYGKAINGLTSNSTLTTSLVMAGGLDSDGTCNGAYFHDGNRGWSNVVVQGILKISLTDYTAIYRVADNNIRLRSGVICPYDQHPCMDIENGPTFWSDVSAHECSQHSYDVLYEGPATKATLFKIDSEDVENVIYTVKSENILFSLMIEREIPLCQMSAYSTEHPKLIIYESQNGLFFFQRSFMAPSSMDLFMYINSKFVYVERHIRGSMTSMYKDITRQKCELERNLIKTQLSYASENPVEFAYNYMKGPGYTALTMGEVVYKCEPVDVTVRTVEECYSELPVTYLNKSMFMTPKTHLLQMTGSPVKCSQIVTPASGSRIHGSQCIAEYMIPKTPKC